MAPGETLLAILKSGSEDSKEQIEALIPKEGWDKVREAVYGVLLTPELAAHSYTAAGVLWGALLDARPMDPDHTIAVLERRRQFRKPDELEDNLFWSITSKLKGVDYLSDYEPLQDPAVQRALERLT